MFLNDVADFHDDFSKNKGKYKEKGTQVSNQHKIQFKLTSS